MKHLGFPNVQYPCLTRLAKHYVVVLSLYGYAFLWIASMSELVIPQIKDTKLLGEKANTLSVVHSKIYD